ncbi:hypothetical protein ACFQV8_15670 [Pseudonocardia benzenivorans]
MSYVLFATEHPAHFAVMRTPVSSTTRIPISSPRATGRTPCSTPGPASRRATVDSRRRRVAGVGCSRRGRSSTGWRC